MHITDRCNLRCAMCVRTPTQGKPAPDLTPEQFRTIGDHCIHRAGELLVYDARLYLIEARTQIEWS